jgi:hypothetical protein
MRHAIVLAVLVGCASVGDPTGLTAPGMYTEADAAVRVFSPGKYQMDFSATGLHLPEHLLVNEGVVELFGADMPCFENRAGFSVIPALSAYAGVQAKTSEITPVLNGPAVVKVHVTYEVEYSCPGPETMHGASDFTFLPGGRIVREDVMVAPSTNTLGVVANCGCQQNSTMPHDLAFTSFWAFDPGKQATQVQANGSPVGAADNVYQACTMYPERAIGVSWQMQAGTSTGFHPNAAAAHVLYWASGAKTLDPSPRSITSAIQIWNTPPGAPSDCAKVLALLADVPIQIGNTVLESTDHDGIYRDAAVHTSSFTVTAHGTAVPAGFAISVDLGGATHALVTRSPAKDSIGVAQRESDNRFLIAFVDGLAANETVTIEPRR